MSVTNLPQSGAAACITVDNTQWSQLLVENRDFCLPHLHSMPPFGVGSRRNIAITCAEKLEWCSYPKVKKIERCVYSFRQNTRTWHTDGQTDRQTDTARRCRPRLRKHRAVKTRPLWLIWHNFTNSQHFGADRPYSIFNFQLTMSNVFKSAYNKLRGFHNNSSDLTCECRW